MSHKAFADIKATAIQCHCCADQRSLYFPQETNFLSALQDECQVKSRLTDNVQISEVRVKEVGEQGQQAGSVSEAVSWVADELDSFIHRVH